VRRREPAHHANAAAASGRGGGGGERGGRRRAGGRGWAAHRTTRSRCRRRSCAAKGAVHKMSESEREGRGRGSWSSSESSPTSACGRRPRLRAGLGTVSRNRDGRKRAMRASGRNAHGTRCSRRTSKCISSHSTDTPSILFAGGGGGGQFFVALEHCGADLACVEAHRLNGSAAVVCQSCGLRKIRLLSVSRIRLSAEQGAW